MTIKLKDETTAQVLESSTPTQIIAEFNSIEQLDEFRQSLSDNNLSKFLYLNDSGIAIGTYENYQLDSISYTVRDDIYKATFAIHKKSNVEIRLEKLEQTQSIQDGAIGELAGIIGGEE